MSAAQEADDSRAELRAWIGLLALPGVGNEALRQLLKAFGSALAVVAAPAPALAQASHRAVASAVADARRALTAPRAEAEGHPAAALAWQTMDWLDQAGDGMPRTVLTLADPRYPAALLEAPDPPSVLYALGHLELLSRPILAIVGSRNATAQGLENARQFAAALSAQGVVIASGMALGIDAAAHEGGLSGPGSTIAVVGTGLDRVYPARHRELARRIAHAGLVLSEYPLGTPPLAAHFPKRNRILAGLSKGTLVVEAALGSGSLITAKLAAECSREVFAIPGSIHAPQSRGCHWLIKQGAKLVDQVQDVFDELALPAPNTTRATPQDRGQDTLAPQNANAPPDPHGVLAAMGHESVGLDTLSARTGLDAAQLSATLLELELAALVVRAPGGLFQRLIRV